MTLASAWAETSWRDAPTDVRDRVIDLVADCVAVAALGGAGLEVQRLVAGHSYATSEGVASVVGSPRGWPAGTAMFLNGAAVAVDHKVLPDRPYTAAEVLARVMSTPQTVTKWRLEPGTTP